MFPKNKFCRSYTLMKDEAGTLEKESNRARSWKDQRKQSHRGLGNSEFFHLRGRKGLPSKQETGSSDPLRYMQGITGGTGLTMPLHPFWGLQQHQMKPETLHPTPTPESAPQHEVGITGKLNNQDPMCDRGRGNTCF